MRAKIFLGVASGLAVLLGGYASYTQAARKSAPVFYFKIAPADPRALLSGDYMALNYDVKRGLLHENDRKTVTFYALPNGVVQTEKTDQPVEIAYRGRRLKLPHQFYFQEGTGKKYETAVYAKMRRLPDGRFLIEALTDEQFNEIN